MKRAAFLLQLPLGLCLFCTQGHAAPTEEGIKASVTSSSTPPTVVCPSGAGVGCSDANTLVLKTVTIKCPTSGVMLATAEAEFSFDPREDSTDFVYGYSISRDTTVPIAASTSSAFHFEVWLFAGVLPLHITRQPEACSAGQSHTFNFVVWVKGSNEFNRAFLEVQAPRLFVTFFDQLLP